MEVKEILSWAVLLLLLAGGILATISAAYTARCLQNSQDRILAGYVDLYAKMRVENQKILGEYADTVVRFADLVARQKTIILFCDDSGRLQARVVDTATRADMNRLMEGQKNAEITSCDLLCRDEKREASASLSIFIPRNNVAKRCLAMSRLIPSYPAFIPSVITP